MLIKNLIIFTSLFVYCVFTYPYNLTVFLSEAKDFEIYGAKLKLRFFGRNISEQIFLSKE